MSFISFETNIIFYYFNNHLFFYDLRNYISVLKKCSTRLNNPKQTKSKKMNLLKIIFLLITIAEADLIGFNRLGNNVHSFRKNGKNSLYGSRQQRQPRYKFRGNQIKTMRRYYKTFKLV